jgi:hypothetical protein
MTLDPSAWTTIVILVISIGIAAVIRISVLAIREEPPPPPKRAKRVKKPQGELP